LRGEPVDRPPNFNIFMAFAARHLGQLLRYFYLDYRVLCEANLTAQRDFSLDILSTMSDPYRETEDWGRRLSSPTTNYLRVRYRFCNRYRRFAS
jgi:uroporphyrinogen decarboxylase